MQGYERKDLKGNEPDMLTRTKENLQIDQSVFDLGWAVLLTQCQK